MVGDLIVVALSSLKNNKSLPKTRWRATLGTRLYVHNVLRGCVRGVSDVNVAQVAVAGAIVDGCGRLHFHHHRRRPCTENVL